MRETVVQANMPRVPPPHNSFLSAIFEKPLLIFLRTLIINASLQGACLETIRKLIRLSGID